MPSGHQVVQLAPASSAWSPWRARLAGLGLDTGMAAKRLLRRMTRPAGSPSPSTALLTGRSVGAGSTAGGGATTIDDAHKVWMAESCVSAAARSSWRLKQTRWKRLGELPVRFQPKHGWALAGVEWIGGKPRLAIRPNRTACHG
jgi:hypothetical protein